MLKPLQAKHKTVIIPSGFQGSGAGVTKAFLEHGYNVVANSRKISVRLR